ncbi:S41 family peptidase [Caloramator proteoclasticus]|uniref:Carboxyl-terminal processing protease n=1 Tax=Caloramator proteoclasticus DSM 10124 TaxID=1121262 RepID=A0A1M5BB15_9CLOT|nr:S41 family peptidase [Caloramator proteoclasticus]SHF39517.1 carboxyl-terminal processing protease [Caloramator proteoclasticus DSM 10124]
MSKRQISIKKAISLILITNLITASILIFVPIPFIGGKKIVSKQEYDFVKQFGKMMSIKSILEQRYVDKIDENKLVEGAVKGMVDGIGDPYTVFMNKKEFEDLLTHTQGSYAGVGLYVGNKDGKIVVVAPIEDTPAYKAGILSGDIIIKVNDQDVSGNELDKATSMMKGPEGTKVKLTIYREGKGTINFELTRAKIIIKSVKSDVIENNIGYIRITTFDENTSEAFNNALDKLLNQGIKGLIIDLRGNPGGLLDQCTKIADRILGEGTIVYTIDNQGKREEWKSDSNKLNVPLVLLVDGGSASASEILTGAVRDFKAGVIIGTRTFGKGLVQDIIPLPNKEGLKVTIARYYTPSGECIQGKGIEPHIVLDLPEKDKERELSYKEDIQIQKAIEVLRSKQ